MLPFNTENNNQQLPLYSATGNQMMTPLSDHQTNLSSFISPLPFSNINLTGRITPIYLPSFELSKNLNTGQHLPTNHPVAPNNHSTYSLINQNPAISSVVSNTQFSYVPPLTSDKGVKRSVSHLQTSDDINTNNSNNFKNFTVNKFSYKKPKVAAEYNVFTEANKMHEQINNWFITFIKDVFKGRVHHFNFLKEMGFDTTYNLQIYEDAESHQGRLILRMNAAKIDEFSKNFLPLAATYFPIADDTIKRWETFCQLVCINFKHYHIFSSRGPKNLEKRLKKELLNYIPSWSEPTLLGETAKEFTETEVKTYAKNIRNYLNLIQLLMDQNPETSTNIKLLENKALIGNSFNSIKQKALEWINNCYKNNNELIDINQLIQYLASQNLLKFDSQIDVGLHNYKANSQSIKELLNSLIEDIKIKNNINLFRNEITQQLSSIPFSENLLKTTFSITKNKTEKIDLPLDFNDLVKNKKVRFCLDITPLKKGKFPYFDINYLIAVECQNKKWNFYPLEKLKSKDYSKAVRFIKKTIKKIEKHQTQAFHLHQFDKKRVRYEWVHPLFPSKKQLDSLSNETIIEDLFLLRNHVSADSLKFPITEGQNGENPNTINFINTLNALAKINIGIVCLGTNLTIEGSSSASIANLVNNINQLNQYLEEKETDEEDSETLQNNEKVISSQNNELIDKRDANQIFKRSTESSINALKIFLMPPNHVDKKIEKQKKQLEANNQKEAVNNKFFAELLKSSQMLEKTIRQFIDEKQELDEIYKINPILTDYQNEFLIRGVKLYQANKGILLADDMGLGKTVQSLALIKRLRDHQKDFSLNPCIIIAPTCALRNWKADSKLLQFSDDAIVYYHGLNRQKNIPNLKNAAIILTTHDTFYNDYKQLTDQLNFAGIVIDEAHLCSNPTSKKFKTMQMFAKKLEADKGLRLVLTGTPIQNQIGDIHAIMSLINPDLLGNFKKFEQYYITPLKNANNYIGKLIEKHADNLSLVTQDSNVNELCEIAIKRLNELKQVIQFCLVRRTKEDPKIIEQIQKQLGADKKVPSKKIYNISFQLSLNQQQYYSDYSKTEELMIIQTTSKAFFSKQSQKAKKNKIESTLTISEEVTKKKQSNRNYLQLRSNMCQMICHPKLLNSKSDDSKDLSQSSFAQKIENSTLEELQQESGKIQALVTAVNHLKTKEKLQIDNTWMTIKKMLSLNSSIEDLEELKIANKDFLLSFQNWLKNCTTEELRLSFSTQLNKIEDLIGKKRKKYFYNKKLKKSKHTNTLLDVWNEFYPNELLKHSKESLEYQFFNQIHRLLWNQTKKILYFTQWLDMEHILAKVLGESFGENVEMFSGKTDDDKRTKIVDDFNQSINTTNLALMLKAGGVGINLGTANHVLILDPWFSPGPLNQASDRARRLTSQWSKVKVASFYAENTIEKSIINCAKVKQEFIEFMLQQDDQQTDNWLLKFLIKDQITAHTLREGVVDLSSVPNNLSTENFEELTSNNDDQTIMYQFNLPILTTVDKFSNSLDDPYEINTTTTTTTIPTLTNDITSNQNYNNAYYVNTMNNDLTNYLNYNFNNNNNVSTLDESFNYLENSSYTSNESTIMHELNLPTLTTVDEFSNSLETHEDLNLSSTNNDNAMMYEFNLPILTTVDEFSNPSDESCEINTNSFRAI